MFRASVQSTWQSWMLLVLIQRVRIHTHVGSSESRGRKQHLCSDIGRGCSQELLPEEQSNIEGRFVIPGAPALKTNQ